MEKKTKKECVETFIYGEITASSKEKLEKNFRMLQANLQFKDGDSSFALAWGLFSGIQIITDPEPGKWTKDKIEMIHEYLKKKSKNQKNALAIKWGNYDHYLIAGWVAT